VDANRFKAHQAQAQLSADCIGSSLAAATRAVHYPNKRHYPIVLAQIIATEFVAVAASAYLASVIYNRIILLRWPPVHEYVPAALYIAALLLLVSLGFRNYTALQTQPRHRFLSSGITSVVIGFAFFLSTIFFVKLADTYSRGTYVFQFIACLFAVLGVRTIIYSWVKSVTSSGLVEVRRAVLIGDTASCGQMSLRLKSCGIHVEQAFAIPVKPVTDSANDFAPTELRNILQICRAIQPDDVFILAAPENLAPIRYLQQAFSELPVSLYVVPPSASGLFASSRLVDVAGVQTIQVLSAPLSLFDRFVKRVLDIAVATGALIVLSPLLLIAGLAIKLDSSGPILFRQLRHGYNNEIIRVFKFRTMSIVEVDGNLAQATKNDPRVTIIGRILRSVNIDELPQLLNVLLGEMSIVGPRPHPISLNVKFQDKISPIWRRHNVKPGITGWAQVNGYRGETDTIEKMQLRLQYDLYYIDNWSLLFDLKIVLMTLFSKRAYMNAY
jgi:Undecaprenyl-phosphate glucose phosphotransferase